MLTAQSIVTSRKEICKKKFGKRAPRLELLGEDARIPPREGPLGIDW
jgi:hypothetical protein